MSATSLAVGLVVLLVLVEVGFLYALLRYWQDWQTRRLITQIDQFGRLFFRAVEDALQRGDREPS